MTFFRNDEETYEVLNINCNRFRNLVFNLNSFGLTDYDVLSNYSEVDEKSYEDFRRKNLMNPLSKDFSDKYDEIYSSHKIYEKIFNLGMREEDKIPIELITRLDSHQHSTGPAFKRFIFYALKYYNADFYNCDLKAGGLNGVDNFYCSMINGKDFDEICNNLLSNDYKTLQPLCTKHRYIFYLTAKRVFNFEGVYSEYQKDSKIYPFISHLSHNCNDYS